MAVQRERGLLVVEPKNTIYRSDGTGRDRYIGYLFKWATLTVY